MTEAAVSSKHDASARLNSISCHKTVILSGNLKVNLPVEVSENIQCHYEHPEFSHTAQTLT
jgi:hypothetical protein